MLPQISALIPSLYMIRYKLSLHRRRCFLRRPGWSLRLCRGFYKVQEASWTVRDRETMEKAEAAGNLVIFEHFDPRG